MLYSLRSQNNENILVSNWCIRLSSNLMYHRSMCNVIFVYIETIIFLIGYTKFLKLRSTDSKYLKCILVEFNDITMYKKSMLLKGLLANGFACHQYFTDHHIEHLFLEPRTIILSVKRTYFSFFIKAYFLLIY